MVASPEEAGTAIEAMRLGATNFLIKTANYYELLQLSINEVIDRFSEKQQTKETIISLKRRVAELEERLGISPEEAPEKQMSPEERRASLIQEVAHRLERGEINLPPYPQINVKFKELLNKGANAAEAHALLKKDVGISSKLISLSNSAYYRGVTENKTLEHAITRLGFRVTKNCVEVITNRSLYRASNKKYNDLLKALWEHSLACAYASEIASKILKLKAPEEVFTIGLLHDIGRLILLQLVSELETNGVFGKELDMSEVLETLNAHHGRFGAQLLKRWGFPEGYCQICMYHDNLEEADPVSKELLVIHMANLLVKSMGYGEAPEEEIDIENISSARFLKMTAPMLTEIKDGVTQIMQESQLGLS
jgi:putative nucleotidyltransferase with HDIG domain